MLEITQKYLLKVKVLFSPENRKTTLFRVAIALDYFSDING